MHGNYIATRPNSRKATRRDDHRRCERHGRLGRGDPLRTRTIHTIWSHIGAPGSTGGCVRNYNIFAGLFPLGLLFGTARRAGWFMGSVAVLMLASLVVAAR